MKEQAAPHTCSTISTLPPLKNHEWSEAALPSNSNSSSFCLQTRPVRPTSLLISHSDRNRKLIVQNKATGKDIFQTKREEATRKDQLTLKSKGGIVKWLQQKQLLLPLFESYWFQGQNFLSTLQLQSSCPLPCQALPLYADQAEWKEHIRTCRIHYENLQIIWTQDLTWCKRQVKAAFTFAASVGGCYHQNESSLVKESKYILKVHRTPGACQILTLYVVQMVSSQILFNILNLTSNCLMLSFENTDELLLICHLLLQKRLLLGKRQTKNHTTNAKTQLPTNN